MKAFQIEDAKTRFFTDKEHYLQFRQAWKDFHNNEHHIERGEWTTPHGNVKEYKYSLLNSGSYMLYNLLRGYDIKRGYCEHSEQGWFACDEAASDIIRTARRLKEINATSSFSQKYAREAVTKLLSPFGGTVTNQMLYDLAAELYKSMTDMEFPAFEVEEEREVKKPVETKAKRKLSLWA